MNEDPRTLIEDGPQGESWAEYRKLVLNELERQDSEIRAQWKAQRVFDAELLAMKFKAGMYGAVASLATVLSSIGVGIAVWIFTRGGN